MSAVYFHHALLHFPIGLVVLAGILYVIGFFRKWETLERTALILAVAGIIFGAAAVTTGLLSEEHFEAEGIATEQQVDYHRNMAIASILAVALGSLLIVVSAGKTRLGLLNISGRLLVIAAAGLIVFAADLGGKMLHPSIGPFTVEHSHEAGGEHDQSGQSHDNGEDHHSPGQEQNSGVNEMQSRESGHAEAGAPSEHGDDH